MILLEYESPVVQSRVLDLMNGMISSVSLKNIKNRYAFLSLEALAIHLVTKHSSLSKLNQPLISKLEETFRVFMIGKDTQHPLSWLQVPIVALISDYSYPLPL